MANGNGASGDPLICDVVQAVREESCEESGGLQRIAKKQANITDGI